MQQEQGRKLVWCKECFAKTCSECREEYHPESACLTDEERLKLIEAKLKTLPENVDRAQIERKMEDLKQISKSEEYIKVELPRMQIL